MLFKNSKVNRIINEEDGSSMVEFALVLPMLIVLTLGGVYLSVSFGQKSIMNGLAFMEARAASVRSNHADIAKAAIENYKKSTEGKQKWVENTKSEVIDGSGDIKIIVTKDSMNIDILANCLTILGGKKPDGKTEIRKIKSFMVLPIEYIPRSAKSDRPLTSTTVNYETMPIGGDFIDKNLLSKLPESIKNMLVIKTLVDPKDDTADGGHQNNTRRADGILSADKTRNMERMNKTYDYWGLDKTPPAGSAVMDETPSNEMGINKLNFLRQTGKYIKALELGSQGASLIIKTTLGPVVDGPLGGIKQVGAVVLPQVIKISDTFAETAEKNNNRMFAKTILGN